MSLTSDTMTPADIAAVCGNNNRNNDGMFGNEWAWIVILLLFGWGRNGFGGFGGGYGNAMVAALLALLRRMSVPPLTSRPSSARLTSRPTALPTANFSRRLMDGRQTRFGS